MEACRWWMGVAGVVVGVATFGTVVGTACWHMAYEEALLQAAAREQRILDLLTENFRQHITSLTEQLEERNTLVTKLLNNDTSSPLPQPIGSEYRSARGAHPQLADAPGDINTRSLSTHNSPSPAVLQQSHTKQTQTVVIGVLGSLTLSVTSVLDAWMELQQSDPISRDVRLVLSPCLTRETLVEDVARLYQDLGVQVFLDDPTTDEVGQLADWAASRPSPRWPVVFVLPSTPPVFSSSLEDVGEERSGERLGGGGGETLASPAPPGHPPPDTSGRVSGRVAAGGGGRRASLPRWTLLSLEPGPWCPCHGCSSL
nr:uncharacterized protein LOC123758788 isoform X2 [Procambarus clarkii]